MILFVDTTMNITVGLLSEKKYSWLAYKRVSSTKSSVLLHHLINELVLSVAKKMSDIKVCVTVAGPGSYTGMRISDGLSQILDWSGIKTYSFLHFEVPKLCGIRDGLWFEKAFKKECFIYTWSKDQSKQQLILESDLESELQTYQNLFSTEAKELNVKGTAQLIKENASEVFKNVIENSLKRDLFYYRSLDQEFGRS